MSKHLLRPSNAAGQPVLLRIVYRRIDELRLDPANPRRHSKKQIRQILNSIDAFGFNVPILTDRYGNVIAGHGRLLAAKLRGMTEVPTLCLDHLSPAQIRAFMIADNRLTEISTWDERLLAEQLKELSLLGLDFDIESTGFEMGEIDLRITSLDDPLDPGDDPADVLPEAPAGPPVSKLGDLWRLGRHCVLCGNALDSEAFATLLGEDRATMVFTDPPYNVPIDGHASGLGAIHHRPFPMASGEMDRPEFTAFLRATFRNLAEFGIDGSLHYVCMDWRHIEEATAAGREVYTELKTSSFGSRTIREWARSTAAGMSLSLSSNTAAAPIAITSSSAGSAATAAMSGVIPGPTPSPAAARKAICSRYTRQ